MDGFISLDDATIGDSFDSSSPSSSVNDFSMSNTGEAVDFLIAVQSGGETVGRGDVGAVGGADWRVDQGVDVDASKADDANIPQSTNILQSEVLNTSPIDIFEFSDDIEEVNKKYEEKEKQESTKMSSQKACCDRFCNMKMLTVQIKLKIESLVGKKNKVEVKETLLNLLKSQNDLGIPTHGFQVSGHFFCRRSFISVSQVSSYLVTEVFNAFNAGQVHFVHGNSVGVRETKATLGFVCWVKQFAENYGNFAPDDRCIVISACFTVKDIFELYKLKSREPQVKKSTFYRLFSEKFGPKRSDRTLPWIRISSYSSHSRCDQCLLLERYQRSCQSEEDLAMAKALKQEHKVTYVRARLAIEEKRLQAINDPNSHVFIQVDDMDNHKVGKILIFDGFCSIVCRLFIIQILQSVQLIVQDIFVEQFYYTMS